MGKCKKVREKVREIENKWYYCKSQISEFSQYYPCCLWVAISRTFFLSPRVSEWVRSRVIVPLACSRTFSTTNSLGSSHISAISFLTILFKSGCLSKSHEKSWLHIILAFSVRRSLTSWILRCSLDSEIDAIKRWLSNYILLLKHFCQYILASFPKYF